MTLSGHCRFPVPKSFQSLLLHSLRAKVSRYLNGAVQCCNLHRCMKSSFLDLAFLIISCCLLVSCGNVTMHICHKPLDGVSLASEGGVRESYDEARKRWGPTATVMVGWWRMEQAEVLLDHGKKYA